MGARLIIGDSLTVLRSMPDASVDLVLTSPPFRPATSEMVVACTSRTRYFDLDAVREPYAEITLKNHGGATRAQQGPKMAQTRPGIPNARLTHAGAPPNDWWDIPTKPYKGAHYATWPPGLLVKPIKAMCPEKVCRSCGEPSRRIVEATRVVVCPQTASNAARSKDPGFGQEGHSARTTLGWSDCHHDDWRPGVVLDPFAGSGTTLLVATGHGRDAIGIDLDQRNAALAAHRVGMFLSDEPPRPVETVDSEALS